MEKYFKLDCSDFSNFDNGTCSNGVLTINLASWDEFHNVIHIFNDKAKGVNTDYFWRGQRCYCEEWKLKSSFDRKYPNINNRKEKLKEIYHHFKKKIEELPDTKSDNLTEHEIWSIGQHYGLPTPLLDWSEDPYIAAYFAFFKDSPNCQTEYRVIYALNRVLKRLLTSKSKDRFIKFYDDLDLKKKALDKIQNERLIKQKGKFTEALNGDDIKINIDRLVRKRPCYQKKVILAKILMPNKVRNECMEFLESKKITHGTLFPDYGGAVEICKTELGIDES
jgi:hypothetical protein